MNAAVVEKRWTKAGLYRGRSRKIRVRTISVHKTKEYDIESTSLNKYTETPRKSNTKSKTVKYTKRVARVSERRSVRVEQPVNKKKNTS